MTFNSFTSKKCTTVGSRDRNYECIKHYLETLLLDWKITSISESSIKFPVYVMMDSNGNFADHIVMAKTKNNPLNQTKPRRVLKR